uniref:AlNc14C420G11517 protein n=1 Tax=Albugo laibachii Nc14 TaxID=890382 RepID=F0WZB4_9STRA|nr:AlNc14C420G11517 [Albugo laibachii Nc14]|eukprot:CCA26832.1 AlNc14C420G11517 [Albugo laibachii Nc14]
MYHQNAMNNEYNVFLSLFLNAIPSHARATDDQPATHARSDHAINDALTLHEFGLWVKVRFALPRAPPVSNASALQADSRTPRDAATVL